MSGFYPPHHPSPLSLDDFILIVLGRLFLFADVLHIASGWGRLFSTTTAGGLGRLVSTIKMRSTILFGGHLCSNTINPPPAFVDSPSARVMVGCRWWFLWMVFAYLVSLQEVDGEPGKHALFGGRFD
uniref:Uncharacterized protein n=1 Tax=Medicago truncatula TaxID=3880 RepID=Q2HTW3_MEDTR|nr:hypothetical protein MtrDRAFT_AC149601g14v2 [Medicago truncatula]